MYVLLLQILPLILGKSNCHIFMALEKHRRVGILNHILHDTATKLFKTQKTNQIPTCMPFGVEQGLHHFITNFSKTTHHCA